jgi:hypothetical protein
MPKKRLNNIPLLIALVATLLFAGLVYAQQSGRVCARANANVRTAPDLRFNTVGALQSGRCYTAYDFVTPDATQTRDAPIDIWYNVQLATQTRGWVAGNWADNTLVVVEVLPIPTNLMPTRTPSPSPTPSPTTRPTNIPTATAFFTPTQEQSTGTPIYVAPEIRIGKIRIIIEFEVEQTP